MIRCPDLPLLPGNSLNANIGQSRFHKSHHFDVKEVPYLSDKDRPGVGGVPLPGSRISRYPSIYARGEAPELPSWITFDRQVLKFNAYFQETIQEVSGYSHLVRKCFIYFFLEDGTVKVVEPKVPNSGIPQGCLMARQRIRLPNCTHLEEFYDIIDFNIGRTVELHGRVFKITDCDNFTRNFLNRLGIPVPDPIETPTDPYTQLREEMKAECLPKKPGVINNNMCKFLEMDRKVLNFNAYWDDRETQFGELHVLQVRYYLADDTMEVKDATIKDNHFLLMHRDKLPKEFKGLPSMLGSKDRATVLNVLGPRYLHDSLDCDKNTEMYYKDSDLMIGAVISLYGRKVVLTNCDPFTKEYYRAKYGIEDFAPLKRPLTEEERVEVSGHRDPPELPPYNGFGTHEDSAINCRTVFPFAPTKSYKQFYEKDKIGYDSHILRFSARLISNKQNDSIRSFIISYYLSDDTICVFEVAGDNSGFNGGMIISRRQIPKPGEEIFGSKPPKCYVVGDFFVGNEVELETFKFILISADEYALHYMERRCNEFPLSNISLIVGKVREALRPLYKEFVAKHMVDKKIPILTFRQFREAMKCLIRNITDHEILTLARFYATEDASDPLPNDVLRSVIQCELKRLLFNSFERLEEAFRYRDPHRTGTVTKETAYSVLRGARLPLDVEVINTLLEKVCTNADGYVKYENILNCMDYKKNPAPSIQPINIPYVMGMMSKKKSLMNRSIDFVQLAKLIEDVDLEKELVQQMS